MADTSSDIIVLFFLLGNARARTRARVCMCVCVCVHTCVHHYVLLSVTIYTILYKL